MRAKIKTGWRLTAKSWQVLRGNKTLLLFPLLSMLTTLAALILIVVPATALISSIDIDLFNNDWLYYLGTFLALLGANFITVFFNVALASQAAAYFRGQETSISAGLGAAWERKKVILQWSVLAAIVGTLLRFIAERLPFGGRIVAALGGFIWAVASWFVVPILALEGQGPVKALKSSVATVKRRWGEGVTGTVAIGTPLVIGAMLLMFAGIGSIIFWLVQGVIALAIIFGVFFFLLFFLLMLIASALWQIFDLAVYLSCSNPGEDQVGPFSAAEIDRAAVSKS
jgi:hypothetical protein